MLHAWFVHVALYAWRWCVRGAVSHAMRWFAAAEFMTNAWARRAPGRRVRERSREARNPAVETRPG